MQTKSTLVIMLNSLRENPQVGKLFLYREPVFQVKSSGEKTEEN
jgi:hypothetical protein